MDTTRLEEFHGHLCIGLALGVRAAGIGLREVAERGGMTVVAETHTCAVDAVQLLTGCTVGNGRLLLRDHGKTVFTFHGDADACRVAGRGVPGLPADYAVLFERIVAGTAHTADRERWRRLQRTGSAAVLEADEGDLFEVTVVPAAPPGRAVAPSRPCTRCGEATMTTYLVAIDGAAVCPPCRHDVPSPRPRSTLHLID